MDNFQSVYKYFLVNCYNYAMIVTLDSIEISIIILEILIFSSVICWAIIRLNQSERQKQQYYQQLLDNEQRFKAIFDQTFQFTGLLKPDGTLLDVNQAALDFGGVSKSDVVNKPFWLTYWWQISKQAQSNLRQAIAKARKGKFVRYPVKVKGKDNHVITIDFSLRPVKDKKGEVILLIPQGTDITKQVEAEQALKKSQIKYRAIIEEQSEFICRHRPDATVSYVNDAFCAYFGIEKEEIIDREYTPIVYEADRERVQQLVSTMTADNPTVTIENRVIAKKNRIRWTQWNNRMIFDQSGNFIEYQSVGRDITPLKEIELKLRESEERFRRAFEDAATGEALVNPDGVFIQVNRSLCEIVGYDEKELLGKTFQEITHPEDLNVDLNYFQQVLRGERRTYQMEKRYFHKSGYVVWILLSVSMVCDIDDELMYFVAQIQDISQRKRTETKLNDLIKELERSNQELDEFASVVSHDLISPLYKQLLIVDLLKEKYTASNCEELNYLEKIISYNSRMDNLVRSLLAYARITHNSQPFFLVDLNEIIADVLYYLKPEITQIKAEVEVSELPTIDGDRLQLNQLFLNLLQNALKFHSHDRLLKIKIEHNLENNCHQIIISDNGIGFEPEQQLKIFAPFHRLYSRSKYQGTGLGLAICEKIVDRHQGTITAQSQPNQGATFTICLPKSVN